MTYFVVGSDGNQYGPADVPTLQQWVADGRIHAATPVKDATSGASLTASAIPGLFAAQPTPPVQSVTPPVAQPSYPQSPYSQPQNPYSQAPQSVQYPRQQMYAEDNGVLGRVIFRAVLAIILAIVFTGAGFIISAFGIFYAFQSMQSGHSKGGLALGISVGTLLAVIAIWAIKSVVLHIP